MSELWLKRDLPLVSPLLVGGPRQVAPFAVCSDLFLMGIRTARLSNETIARFYDAKYTREICKKRVRVVASGGDQ